VRESRTFRGLIIAISRSSSSSAFKGSVFRGPCRGVIEACRKGGGCKKRKKIKENNDKRH
jgi:hypothetical protein